MYKYLGAIRSPEDVKKLSTSEKIVLAQEIRAFLIASISKTGGHLASNLGVVELTIALHTVFNSPQDQFIWDVGHQAYVHKLLTGRMNGFDSLRQHEGMSGFPKRNESVHDHFDTGHSSTSISAGVGMAIARDLSGKKHEVISIIGDGALTGGMALEALNHLGHCKANVKVILNDNEMSISRNVGGMSLSLNKLRTNEKYYKLKGNTKRQLMKLPSLGKPLVGIIRKFKGSFKYFLVDGSAFFEEMGLKYIGPINGHDLEGLMKHLEMVKHVEEPVLLHVITQKGKGYPFAEQRPNKYHGVSAFNPIEPISSSSKVDYSKVFGDTLALLAADNPKIVAISAAMIEGTGLSDFSERFPNRIFDVGIAEQHAVTLAAGMALNGLKPFVAIYSTFLQRAYDQVVHDVCIQRAPVVLCIDRAGLVGNDGETHHGVFDISYLSHLPNLMILSPKDQNELKAMLTFASTYMEGPIAIRYPRGVADFVNEDPCGDFEPELLKQGEKIGIIATGKMVKVALAAAEKFKEAEVGVINLRKIKPMDASLKEALSGFDKIITIEDHMLAGGMNENVSRFLRKNQMNHQVFPMGIEDTFVEQGDMDQLLTALGLDESGVLRKLSEVFNG